MDAQRIAGCCRRHGVKRLWVLAQRPAHDGCGADDHIDVLVDADDPVSLLRLGGLQMDLSDLAGRLVHVITLGGLGPERRAELLSEARLAYAA